MNRDQNLRQKKNNKDFSSKRKSIKRIAFFLAAAVLFISISTPKMQAAFTLDSQAEKELNTSEKETDASSSVSDGDNSKSGLASVNSGTAEESYTGTKFGDGESENAGSVDQDSVRDYVADKDSEEEKNAELTFHQFSM